MQPRSCKRWPALRCALLALIGSLLSAQVSAVNVPQETWTFLDEFGDSRSAVAFDGAGNIHTVTGNAAFVYAPDGSLLRTFPTPNTSIGIAADPAGNTYVLASNELHKYDSTGVFQRSQPMGGPALRVNRLADGLLAVGTGTRLLLIDPVDLSIDADLFVPLTADPAMQFEGNLIVGNVAPTATLRLPGIFDRSGELLRILSPVITDTGFTGYSNGIFSYANRNCGPPVFLGTIPQVCLTTGTGEGVGTLATPFNAQAMSSTLGPDDLMYVPSAVGIVRFKRGYRSALGTLLGTTYLPVPVITGTARRAGTSVLDIDYEVRDRDSPSVAAWPLAFRQNARSISNLVVPAAFVDGTAANRGATVPTGVSRRLSWDVAADVTIAGTFERFRIEILANDGRALQEIHWVTIPAGVPSGSDPPLKVSAQPLKPDEMLNLWLWLVATGDPSVQLVSGEVRGTSGAYAGQALASGTTTSALGKQFLFELLGVRAATTAERDRALAASSPGIQQLIPRNRTTIGPEVVNELGIEVNVSGDYVVDL